MSPSCSSGRCLLGADAQCAWCPWQRRRLRCLHLRALALAAVAAAAASGTVDSVATVVAFSASSDIGALSSPYLPPPLPPLAPDGDAAALPPFYVYEGPAFDGMARDVVRCHAAAHDGRPPWQNDNLFAEHISSVWIHRALVDHPSRTRDPEAAAVFFIPVYPVLSERVERPCNGRVHRDRMAALLEALRASPYFRRYGGSDHTLVCASINCRLAFEAEDREVLGRVAVGNNERGTLGWTWWPCFDRVVAVPYAARTDLLVELAALPPSKRSVTFFFAGSMRHRPERANLAVLQNAVEGACIQVAKSSHVTRRYVGQITSARFCLVPRGDTPSSRRLFDAVAAGCIPVVPEVLRREDDLPFADAIPYERFAAFVPDADFESREAIAAMARRLLAWPAARLDAMHAELMRHRDRLVVARRSGDNASFAELAPSPGLAEEFLRAAARLAAPDRRWSCRPSDDGPFNARTAARVAAAVFPAEGAGRRDEWFGGGAATVVNFGRRLLLCDVPGAGTAPLAPFFLQPPLVAADGVYRGSGRFAAGFAVAEEGAAAAEGAARAPAATAGMVARTLPVDDGAAMAEIYGLGWVRAVVARDPMTRLLAIFLALSTEEVSAVVTAASGGAATAATPLQRSGAPALAASMAAEWCGSSDGGAIAGSAALFRCLVSSLASGMDAGAALENHPQLRPQSGFCGARYRPFDAVIKHESLDRDGEGLLRSLGLWEGAAAPPLRSGVSADTVAADAAVARTALKTAAEIEAAAAGAATALELAAEVRAGVLFSGCGWAEFYDAPTLRLARQLYAEDYERFPWYDGEAEQARGDRWDAALVRCLSSSG